MRHLLRIIAMAWLCSLPALALSATWHMPTPYPDSEHHTRNIRIFTDEVRKATGGELDITLHSGGALFQHTSIHRAVRTGQVPIGELLMGLLGNDNPLFKLDNIPFLATDFAAAKKLWEISRPEIEKALAEDGLQLLFAVPWPPQGLYANRPIDSVAQLGDVKLRAYSPLTARLADLIGATPVNVQAPEIAQAFSTGMIDAMITSASTGVSSQAWDYVDYYIDLRAWIPKNMVIANRRALRRLPAAQRDTLFAAARRAEARGWRMAEEDARVKTRVLRENGIKVVAPSDRLQGQLTAAGRRLAEEWAREWSAETGGNGRAIIDAMAQAQ